MEKQTDFSHKIVRFIYDISIKKLDRNWSASEATERQLEARSRWTGHSNTLQVKLFDCELPNSENLAFQVFSGTERGLTILWMGIEILLKRYDLSVGVRGGRNNKKQDAPAVFEHQHFQK